MGPTTTGRTGTSSGLRRRAGADTSHRATTRSRCAPTATGQSASAHRPIPHVSGIALAPSPAMLRSSCRRAAHRLNVPIYCPTSVPARSSPAPPLRRLQRDVQRDGLVRGPRRVRRPAWGERWALHCLGGTAGQGPGRDTWAASTARGRGRHELAATRPYGSSARQAPRSTPDTSYCAGRGTGGFTRSRSTATQRRIATCSDGSPPG